MKLIHNILFLSGKPWAVQAAGQPFVYFEYNLAGDNTKVYSSVADDWERNYTYDWLGRRLTYTEGVYKRGMFTVSCPSSPFHSKFSALLCVLHHLIWVTQ